MAHNHGSEYQVRIVHGDGTEELSGWLNSAEQVAQTIAADRKSQGKAYWLRARNVLWLADGRFLLGEPETGGQQCGAGIVTWQAWRLYGVNHGASARQNMRAASRR